MSSPLKLRPSLRAFAFRMIASILLAALVMGSTLLFRDRILSLKGFGEYLLISLLVLPALFAAVEVLSPIYFVRTHRYFVGSNKVEEDLGAFSRRNKAVFVSQIREVEVTQGVIGRLLNYGDVMVAGGLGPSDVVLMRHVHDPMRVKAMLESMIGNGKGAENGSSAVPAGLQSASSGKPAEDK